MIPVNEPSLGDPVHMGWGDVQAYAVGLWPYNRWQTAGLLLDIGLIMTPLAMVSGIRRAGYIRKLYTAQKGVDTGKKTAAVTQAAIDMPVRTGFIVYGGVTGIKNSPVNPFYHPAIVGGVFKEVLIATYIDRQGRLVLYLPHESRDDESHVFPAARDIPYSGGSFFSLERWKMPSVQPTGVSALPLDPSRRLGRTKSGSTAKRGRRRSSARASRPPYCRVHKRKHWCKFSRRFKSK